MLNWVLLPLDKSLNLRLAQVGMLTLRMSLEIVFPWPCFVALDTSLVCTPIPGNRSVAWLNAMLLLLVPFEVAIG